MDSALSQRLARPDAPGRTEADIQSDVKMLLLAGGFNLGDEQVKLEEQMGDGTRRRIDVAVGATVVEVKKVLRDQDQAAAHIEQLGGYVATRRQQEGSRYNGILTNGRTWWLYETVPGSTQIKKRADFTLTSADRIDSLREWIQSVLATRTNVTPEQKSIEALLGSTSPAYEQDHAYLADLYEEVKDDPTVQLKRSLWARLLRSALGDSFDDQADHLFLDHTLLVIEAATIAHAVMDIPLADLAADPARLLRGDEFSAAQIYNAVESDFFDWVLSATDGMKFVTTIVRRVSSFNWHRTEHDVLKVLYESVINQKARKSMGEYYTPDWLAEGIVERAVTAPLTQRVLDPACGSGTFVFQAVRRVVRAAEREGLGNREILEHVENHVFGLDIHPVSVMLARVTYLLALGSRLQGERGAVTIPVHLGDSMQWYQPAKHEADIIRIKTDSTDLTALAEDATLFEVGRILAFPLAHVQDPSTFDRLVTELTNHAKQHTDSKKARPKPKAIFTRFGIPEGPDRALLQETFDLLCDLNAEGKDSIWGYFVRNQVRPLWLSLKDRRVDVLVGNPPWVAYRYMTETMQKQFRTFSEDRNLWHGAKIATNQDLVGLFIVRSVEKYLRNEGSFGFVTPLAVLSRQQYEGFRAGDWGTYLRGEFTEAWDLDKVRPTGFFPVPGGVVFGIRHDREPVGEDFTSPPFGFPDTKFAVAGRRDKSGWTATKDALTFTETKNRALTSEAPDNSPYLSLAVQGATIVPRVLWFVTEEESTSRLGQASGTTAVRSHRTSQEKTPWKELTGLSGVVPSRFIFNVHLGSTITPFRQLAPWRAVLPVSQGKLLTEQQIKDEPQLRSWWDTANELWTKNRSDRNQLTLLERLNFQNGMSRQLSGATHRVLYSASGNTIAATRTADSSLVLEHALYWIAASTVDEARYLTAILNAPATTELVREYQSRGLFGGRHFDRYVWYLPIPTFTTKNFNHVALARLAAEAEQVAEKVDVDGMGFQKARSAIRQALEREGLDSQLSSAVEELLLPGV